MYINPILFGALCTIVGEMVVIFALAIFGWYRNNRGNRK